MTINLNSVGTREFYRIPTLKIKTKALKFPVTVEQVKLYLGIDEDNNDFNPLLIRLLSGAVRRVEDQTNRRIITQHWYQYEYDWPEGDYIELRINPVQSITAVNYKLSGTTTYTAWSSNYYALDSSAEPARLWVREGYSWPSNNLSDVAPIQIDFKAGYGDDEDDADPELSVAVMQLVEHWFENRGTIVTGTIVAKIPDSVQDILDSKKIYFY